MSACGVRQPASKRRRGGPDKVQEPLYLAGPAVRHAEEVSAESTWSREQLCEIPCTLCERRANAPSVVLSASVRSIGRKSFHNWETMESVIIRASAVNQGHSAATLGVLINKLEGHEPGVVQLVQQLAPDDPGEIADEAFSGCEALARVDIPAAVETIGSYAFSGCDGLETIVLPPSVKEIGDWAFLGCVKLQELPVRGQQCRVTSIGEAAFFQCTAIAGKVIIPASVTHIGRQCFAECENITEVVLPASTVYVGEGAFYRCQALVKVTVGDQEFVGPGCGDLPGCAVSRVDPRSPRSGLWGISRHQAAATVVAVMGVVAAAALNT